MFERTKQKDNRLKAFLRDNMDALDESDLDDAVNGIWEDIIDDSITEEENINVLQMYAYSYEEAKNICVLIR